MQVGYVVNERHGNPFQFDCTYDPLESNFEEEWAAAEAAQDFHDNHDGWESSWPLDITLYVRGQKVATYSVEREARPEFTASKK